MARVERRIKMYEFDMVCDKCGDGYMRPDGVVIPTLPAKYPHTCDNCGARAEFDVQYPYIGYIYKDTGTRANI